MLCCAQAFGELALLCNIPQPTTVTALELVHVLRLDKEALSTVISMYIVDGREVLFLSHRCYHDLLAMLAL